jgi:ribosomal protein S18 acetylase RimI-like enzyme
MYSNDEKVDQLKMILKEVFENDYEDLEMIDTLSDSQFFYVLVYEGIDKSPIATGILITDENKATVKSIAVRKDYRRKQYGDMVVRMLVEKAKSLSFTDIEVRVPLYLATMFEAIGFLSIDELKLNNDIKPLNSLARMKYINNYTRKCKNIDKNVD